jgi:glycosyltransferase involved in cell wall biosynthesis
MSCGIPVIAANSSSLPEVVGDGGVLLDPDDESAWADAIERIVSDGSYAARLGVAALARATMFSWQRTAAETSRVYLRVLGGETS